MLRALVTSDSDSGRGQVGIGTLIVFIAMVLVATIATGVLITTAGFLQSSAGETGQQSSDQVTNRLGVVSTVGTQINEDENTVGRIDITVRKAPGAGNIDLGATTLQVVHSSGSYDLTYAPPTKRDIPLCPSPCIDPESAPNATNFNTVKFQDDDTSITDRQVLNDPSDRATIYVDIDDLTADPNAIDNSNFDYFNSPPTGLQSGETVTIRLTTQSGGTTEIRLEAPETLSSDAVML